jgi:inward rectifier potassium channel
MTLKSRRLLKVDKNTGFGNNADAVGGRLVNKDGIANTKKTGISLLERNSWFHTLLKISWWKFILLIFSAFILVNLIFTGLYYVAGVRHLSGIVPLSGLDEFGKVFFFSIQTFTTVGYGHISPNGYAPSIVSSIEAFTGLLFFAIATGLLYGRFSKPNAFIRFSEHAVFAPYEGITALMFRLVPYKNNHLTDADIKLNLAMINEVDGKRKTEYFQLKTELGHITSLVLSWTVVHPIDEESPLYGMTIAEINEKQTELLVFLKAFDETFSNMVVARTSYLHSEMVYGAKFRPMYHRSINKKKTTIEINKLNDFDRVDLDLKN